MSRWRIILTGIRPQARPKRDTPKIRYFTYIRAGSSDLGACRLVADSYGLPVYLLDDDGRIDPERPIYWTLPQIERVLFQRWLVEAGRVGGPNDGEKVTA